MITSRGLIRSRHGETMRRREFIGAVGTVLVVATIGSARAAERKRSHRIAIVISSAPVTVITESTDAFWPSLFNELRRLGHVEGDNLVIERYSGEGRASHYPELARDVVSRDPDMIFAIGNDLVLDFKAATTAIPIVGLFASPVETGIVASLARPGGNITGVSVDVGTEQWDKRIQLLQQVVPRATRLGSSNREQRVSGGAPLNANLTDGWESPGLARRSITRQTRLSIAVYSPP